MDTFARGLKNAVKIVEDGVLSQALNVRQYYNQPWYTFMHLYSSNVETAVKIFKKFAIQDSFIMK